MTAAAIGSGAVHYVENRHCESPPDFDYAKLVNVTSLHLNGIAIYKCLDRYELIDNDNCQLVCSHDASS